MAENLNLFDTYYMYGSVQELRSVPTFFADRYFPTGAGDIFASDKVLVEFKDGDQTVAPFVHRKAGQIPLARDGYEVHEFIPPYIAPSRPLTLDQLQQRGFGEAILSNSTQAERARRLQAQDLQDLMAAVDRRIEWMAVQTMKTNGIDGVALVDAEGGEEFTLKFYGGSNPALYTVSEKWTAGADDEENFQLFRSDVAAMVRSLRRSGLPQEDLVIGGNVADFLWTNSILRQILDNKNIAIGQLAPKYSGVEQLGVLNFAGTNLNIFVADEQMKIDGSMTDLFPADAAMVTAPGCGHTMQGQVTQMEPNGEYVTLTGRYIPKLVVDQRTDSRELRIASRPLTAPKAKAPWRYAAAVV